MPAASTELRSTFEKYDTDNDGVLNEQEVLAMMTDLQFEVDGSYLKGVLETFGRFDTDGSGGIEFDEFTELHRHLNSGGEEEAEAEASAVGGRAEDRALRASFDRFDLNGDGVLDEKEISSMMVTMGFAADRGYLTQMLSVFGAHDTDKNGLIDYMEFEALYSHLGGAESEAHAANGPAPVPAPAAAAAAEDPFMRSKFDLYDLNKNGMLEEREVVLMMEVKPVVPQRGALSNLQAIGDFVHWLFLCSQCHLLDQLTRHKF